MANMDYRRRQSAIPKSFRLYGKILNAYNRVGMLPLRWTDGHVSFTKSNRVWLAVKLAITWSHIVFLNIQCARSWFVIGPTLNKLYFTLQANVYSATAVNFGILIYNPCLTAAMVNNSLGAQRRHNEIALQGKGTVPRLVLKVTLFLCVFAPLTFVARVLKEPADPRSVVSLTSNPNEVAGIWKIMCCMYQLYSFAAISSSLWLTVSTVSIFLTTVTGIIRETKKTGSEDFLKARNETAVLLIWFNSVFSLWTLVWEATFIWVLVIDMTIAVMKQSIRALLVAGCIATMMMYLYNSMGEVYEESKEITKVTIPRKKDAAWFKQRCRALRPLKVHAGSFYYVDKGLILTILSIALQNTANLIITLNGA